MKRPVSDAAREAEFLAVYKEWSEGRLTQTDAAARMSISERTFRRYVSCFRAHGLPWPRDLSCRRSPCHRAPDHERDTLKTLYSEQYVGWSVRHFYDRYREEHGGVRSYTWVKDCLQTAGLVEKRTRVALHDSRRHTGARTPIRRSPREGMLLHHIASRNKWATDEEWDLILTLDDATGRVHSGFFVKQRGVWSLFAAIREALMPGLFDCISLGLDLPVRLAASETAFGGRTMPQLVRLMAELEIDIVRPGASDRMRNARMFRTLLGRLPKELAREGIAEVKSANSYLDQFWLRFNRSSTVAPKDSSDAFTALEPEFMAKVIDWSFCLKHEARTCTRNRLMCRNKTLDVARLGCHSLQPSEQYSLHEYGDGRCVLFNRYDRVAAFELDLNGDLAGEKRDTTAVVEDPKEV